MDVKIVLGNSVVYAITIFFYV